MVRLSSSGDRLFRAPKGTGTNLGGSTTATKRKRPRQLPRAHARHCEFQSEGFRRLDHKESLGPCPNYLTYGVARWYSPWDLLSGRQGPT